MTRTAELPLGEGAGVGVWFGESPTAVRVTAVDAVEFEGDAGGLLGWAAGVTAGEVEVDDDDDDDGDEEVAGGWPSVRNFERILEASLGETVVVVVELTELPVTVTVTVTAFGFPIVEDVEVELDLVELEELLDDGVVVVEPSSFPVIPPVTPAAVITPRTVLSLVQTRSVPGARTLGTAKHCRLCGH